MHEISAPSSQFSHCFINNVILYYNFYKFQEFICIIIYQMFGTERVIFNDPEERKGGKFRGIS